jgi:hypothetical protein
MADRHLHCHRTPGSERVRLLDHARNVYSQTGEDGIIAKILEMLPSTDHWCVEFGAWDGQYLSNTCHLIESGYSAVLIEADPKRCVDLQQRHGANSRVMALNRFVGFSASDGLDRLLADTAIPRDFDLLSIDIDGNDYHVWNAVSAYRPKVVCIEYNPSIPTDVDFIQPADPNVSQGSSLLALTRLAARKGYELVCVTALNALFVDAKYYEGFHIACNEPTTLREDTSTVAHIFSGYDGTLFVTGAERTPWHGIRYQARLRQLPRFFRHYPGSFGRPRTQLFRLYRRISRLLHRA